jgi:hypothetical protein
MLRWIMGDDNFFEACRDYLNNAGDFGVTSELQEYLENHSGINLDEFFADWYYGQGYPSYDLKWSHVGDSLIVTLGQIQSHPSVTFFEMPVPILARLDGTDFIFRVNHTMDHQRFAFNIGGATVDSIGIDPDLWLLSRNNTIEQVITATNHPDLDQQILVYPTPSDDFIQIQSPVQISSVTLIDLTGRTFPLQIDDNNINLTNFSPGMYSLWMGDAEGKMIAVKRILISQ